MKNGKKWLISSLLSLGLLFSVTTPMLLPSYADGVLTAIGLIDTVEKALKYTITIGNALESENPLDEALIQSGHGNIVGATVDQSLQNYLGQSECKISSYTFLYGKYTLKYTDTNAINRELMVTCSIYYTNSTPTNQSETYPERVITGPDGLQYLTNNIYFTIYRDDGYYKRYRYQCYTDLLFTQMFRTESWGDATGCLTGQGCTIYRDANSVYYDVSDGSLLGSNTGWGGSSREVKFVYSNKNSIVYNPHFNDYNSTTYARYDFMDSNSSWKSYPDDKDICFGYFSNVRESSSSGSATFYSVPKYVLGYFDTNDYGNNRYFYSDYGNTNQNYFNYYYDNSYQADTIINNNNKSTVFDGTLSNAFDLNGNVIMPVDLEADITPLINAGVNNLSLKLDDFFDDMPDFNMPWNQRNTDNNYFDLVNPLPPAPPTTGIVVDITRPLIPEVNTNPHVSFSYPTVTTTALPPSIISAGGQIVSVGKDITDMCGTTNLIVVCGLIGVGVMLIFKDW